MKSNKQARQVWRTICGMDSRWKYYPNRSEEITKEQFDMECLKDLSFTDEEWETHMAEVNEQL